MPKVHNKYHKTAPADAVYIGRGSPFGNPFIIGKDGDRDKVCDLYMDWAESQPEFIQYIKRELRGKDLICFCKPQRCHGDFLIMVANGG